MLKRILMMAAVVAVAGAASATAQQAAQQPTPAPAPAAKATAKAPSAKTKAAAPAKMKWSADQIKDVQTALQKGNFYSGPINGVWGATTRAALKKYQEANKLPATGRLTQELYEKLKSGSSM